jgi:CBS domain-containing protein
MTKSVVSIGPDTNAQDAAKIMLDKWFRHLPVATEDGRVLGIISLRDLLSLLFEDLDAGDSGAGRKLVRDRRADRVEKGE